MIISRLHTITGHGLLIGPDVPKEQGGDDPKRHAEMVEVVEVRPHASLPIAALHQGKDVHEQHHQESDPSQDGVV